MATGDQKGTSCGSCDFVQHSPATIQPATKAIGFKITFEEALRLKAAIDEGVARLNRFNRARKAGKDAKLNLIVYPHSNRIQITEVKK